MSLKINVISGKESSKSAREQISQRCKCMKIIALTQWQTNCLPCRSSVRSMRFNQQSWKGQGQIWGPMSHLSMRPSAETRLQAMCCSRIHIKLKHSNKLIKIFQSTYWAKQCLQGARQTSSMLFHLLSSVESQATISHQHLNRTTRLWSMN